MAVSREICKACWHVNPVGFHVPDDIWTAVVPEQLPGAILCLGCFCRLADEKGVEWDKQIEFWPISLITFNRVEQKSLLREMANK